MANQRDVMRAIWARVGPDEERAITEYAAAERRGETPRKSTTTGATAEQYARRLLYDGLKKEWLGSAKGRSIPEPGRGPRRADRSHIERSVAAPSAVQEESSAYLDRIAAWRAAWRPARVRGLLVAES